MMVNLELDIDHGLIAEEAAPRLNAVLASGASRQALSRDASFTRDGHLCRFSAEFRGMRVSGTARVDDRTTFGDGHA